MLLMFCRINKTLKGITTQGFKSNILSIIILQCVSSFCRFELEASGQHVIDKVVQVVSLDELLPLVARVHGHPAQLVIGYLPLHEVPHWLPHHRHWL